ncbi:tripartite motif-containing protein 16-like [Trematomus bernacchii]|uniref:tripartite motif-containing protein 16-like n=1 Tax=Trematomus bernacchii TaxID=40690 RepID=UPI00146CCBDB|nr:tripartite motif-containing protein 16-like [Trematomus bernacchii]
MALQIHQLGRDELCCFICKDLMKDPVTIACGYSYCKSCISRRWDGEKQAKIYSCPHCRQTFEPRPALVISTVLANLVEEEKKKTEPQAGPSYHRDAGPGEVGCSPTRRKRKSLKSNLQPHDEVPFKKTKLIEASKLHEMSEKQNELAVSRQNIQQRIHYEEKIVEVLLPEVEAINLSADEAVRECTELVKLIEQRSSDVTQKIKSRQKYEVSRVKDIQEMLQKDISDLRRKDTELEKLSQTDDQIKFLQAYRSLSNLRDPEKPFRVKIGPVRYFKGVTAAVSEARGKVLESFDKEWMKISEKVPEVYVKLLPDPQTKADISQYTGPKVLLKLDPNTASMQIQLSEDNRKATKVKKQHSYDPHVDRFMARSQVLCGKGLTNRCYWEVEVSGFGVSVAVAYRDVPRTGQESAFGDNDKSWALELSKTICNFKHNGEKKAIPVSVLQSSRIGVFLDQKAGVLFFYSVSETITLLHRVHTTFKRPLYAGLGVHCYGASATFRDI